MKCIFFSLLFSISFAGNSQVSKIELKEIIDNSFLIIEGKVVEKKSFKHPATQMIFTSNFVKVHKVFKGVVNSYEVEILTAGGSLGNETTEASDLLNLNKNDAGIFFINPNPAQTISPFTGNRMYDVYAASQGFIKYNSTKASASSPFYRYRNISRELYPLLIKMTGRGYIIIDRTSLFQNKKIKKKLC